MDDSLGRHGGIGATTPTEPRAVTCNPSPVTSRSLSPLRLVASFVNRGGGKLVIGLDAVESAEKGFAYVLQNADG